MIFCGRHQCCGASIIKKSIFLELVLQLTVCDGLARMAELELKALESPSAAPGREEKWYRYMPSSRDAAVAVQSSLNYYSRNGDVIFVI